MTSLFLLGAETACALICSRRFVDGKAHERAFAWYLALSVLVGIPNHGLAAIGKSNSWTVHVWVLICLIWLGRYCLARVRNRNKSLTSFMFSVCVTVWFGCAFTLGVSTYYHCAHMLVFAFLLSCTCMSKYNDSDLSALFAIELLNCSVPLFWHSQFPVMWHIRNIAWVVILAHRAKTHAQ